MNQTQTKVQPSHPRFRHHKLLALLLLAFLPACGLTDVQTKFDYDGPAEPLLVALSDGGAPALPPVPLGDVHISYSTPSNKAITWVRNDIQADGAEVYREAVINTDHDPAVRARDRDNSRVENQTDTIVGAIGSAFQMAASVYAPVLAAQTAPPAAPVPPAESPPPATKDEPTDDQAAVIALLEGLEARLAAIESPPPATAPDPVPHQDEGGGDEEG